MRNTISLNGPWRFRQVGETEWVPADVPGCVHTDLMAAGRIPDPLHDLNELDVLWIDEADWEYKREFDLDEAATKRAALWLVCEGLDTIAEISVNDHAVSRTQNMFRRYRFDVAEHVRPGENRIRIVFRSPVRIGKERAAATGAELPGTEYTWSNGRTRKVYRPYVRKAQYQFGWDWGPCLATSGIWRDIHLIATDTPVIEYVTTQQRHDANHIALTVTAHLLSTSTTKGTLAVRVGDAVEQMRVPCTLEAGESTTSAGVLIEDPHLWQPVGYGEPYLYPLEVSWETADGEIADTHATRVGLRTVELIREPDDVGESWTLRVNGRDIFCKGANWIPADPFPHRVPRERYAALIDAALDANMNMLRVWGGGIFEHDAFYELCDERGVLVWQDLMFACAGYPADNEFLAEAAAETRHQIRRLHNHPCIALWCGDNENEWLIDAFWSKMPFWPTLRKDYKRLINDTLAPVVQEEDPQRPWWPGSPSNGGGGVPNDPDRGDAHFWEVWHERKPFERYQEIMPRFCSEFGFQSLPSLATLRSAISTPLTSPDDETLQHHQRHARGYKIIKENIKRLFREPCDLTDWCYLSQITHGLALQTAVEHWRRGKPRCMGALYWQLQDCWVVSSWASVDYELRYKAAHYFAKRFYAPLMSSFARTENSLELWATSDLPQAVSLDARIEAWTVAGECHVLTRESLELPVQANQLLTTIPLDDLTQIAPAEELVVRCVTEANGRRHENFHLLARPGDVRLQHPQIETEVAGSSAGYTVRVTTDVPALYVEFDAGPVRGTLSDNYIALYPDAPVELTFRPQDAKDLAGFSGALHVRSLVTK